MRHRPERVTDSVRNAAAAGVKRITFFFAEGCVDSLINIHEAEKDAEKEEDIALVADINQLLIDLGMRDEQKDQ